MHSITTIFALSMALVHSTASMALPTHPGVATIEKRTNAFVEDSAVSAFTPYTANKVPNPTPALLKYIQDTQAGLNQLTEVIDQGNKATAQNIYTTLSGYFDAMFYYVHIDNKGCDSTGPGHQVDANEAHALIITIEETLNTLATVDGLDKDKALYDVCKASGIFFNSGLREFIFHNQNSGTGN